MALVTAMGWEGLIPGLGTSTHHGHGKKTPKKTKTQNQKTIWSNIDLWVFECKQWIVLQSIDSSKLECEINGRDMGSLHGKCIKAIFCFFFFFLR